MLYGKLIKPLLFSLPPEQAHHIVTATLSLLGKVPGGRWLLHKLYATEDPVARTRSLRHPFQESRRNGRRIRPLRPHLPRTVGHGFRIRRGGKHHPQASAGQSQAAHLPARRGPRAAQPRRHLQPRSRPRRGAPATAARRGDRRLQPSARTRPHPATRRRPTTSNASATSTSTPTISRSTSPAIRGRRQHRTRRAKTSRRFWNRSSNSAAGRTSTAPSC